MQCLPLLVRDLGEGFQKWMEWILLAKAGQADPRCLVALWCAASALCWVNGIMVSKQSCAPCWTLVALKQSQTSWEAVLCAMFSLWVTPGALGAFSSCGKVSILVFQDLIVTWHYFFLTPPTYYCSHQGELICSAEFNWWTACGSSDGGDRA